MSFGTENRTVGDIFQRVAKYSVPRYQRGYVWTKVNWSELLNDVKFTVKCTDTNWSHFLGAIVLINRTEQNKQRQGYVSNGISEYDIIDGQQRLITIYILLMCLCYRFQLIDMEASQNRAEYFSTTFLTSLNSSATRERKIYSEDCQRDIDGLYQAIIDKEMPSMDNQFYSVFSFFNDELVSYDFDALVLFSEKLLSINLIEITSTQEEEIYNIFEVLNARGKKLKQMELLKNHVMKYIQPRTADIVDKAKNKWNSILEKCKQLSDEDVLLVHFCKCYIRKKAENSDMVYKLIKEEIPIDDLSKFLDDFVEYAGCYESIASGPSGSDIEYFDIKRTQQARSLLAAIEVVHSRGIITDDEKNIAIHNLRNFFFLFHACSYTSNKTENSIAKAAYEVYHVKSELDFKFVVSNVFVDLSRYLSDRSINELVFTTPALHYSNKNSTYKTNGKLVKYVLCCLYAPLQRDTVLDQSKLTIEHLLNDDGSVGHSAIYNLTLTSSDINGNDLKDKSMVDKVNILKERSSVIANQHLSDYMDESGNYLEEKRLNDFRELAVNNVFHYKDLPFSFSKEDVANYFKMQQVLQDDQELSQILLEKGTNIKVYLENDPTKKEAYQRFVSACGFLN